MRQIAQHRLRWLYAAILAVGVWLRVWSVEGRPFWRDEAWVAHTVTLLTPAGLCSQTDVPLPPLFGVTANVLGGWFSPAEFALRLPAMIAGVATLPLAYAILRTLRLPRIVALSGMAWCGGNLMLVLWSRELKQYSIEAFLAALLAFLVFRLRRTRRSPAGFGAAIVLLVAIAPWFGYGFVFAAVPLLFLATLPKPPNRRYAITALIGLAGLATLCLSVTMLMWTCAAGQSQHAALVAFTRDFYVDLSRTAGWGRAISGGLTALWQFLLPPVRLNSPWPLVLFAVPLIAIAAIGLRSLPRRCRLEMAIWTIAPAILMLLAGAAQIYPWGAPRTMVLLVPPIVLSIAMGLVAIGRMLCRPTLGRTGPGLVAPLVLSLVPMAFAARVPLEHAYWTNEDVPALLRTLKTARAPNEWVFVSLQASSSVRYYGADLSEPVEIAPAGAGLCALPEFDYAGQIDDLLARAGEHFWIIATNDSGDELGRMLLQKLAQASCALSTHSRHGSPSAATQALLLEVRRK